MQSSAKRSAAELESESISIALTDEEQSFLRWGLELWRGPIYPSQQMRQGLGFVTSRELFDWVETHLHRVREETTFSRKEWTTVLALSELAFASETAGGAADWAVVSAIPDEKAIKILRSVQRKLRRVILRYDVYSGELRGAMGEWL